VTAGLSCPRESEVLEVVAIGQWPGRADESLRDHVSGCSVCSDLATIASAIADLGDASITVARVPDAAVVWYRAQLAAREEAARKAVRPMLLAHLAAAAGAAGIGLVAWRELGTDWLAHAWTALTRFRPPALPAWDATWFQSAAATWWWVLAAMGAWALLVPAAFYLARFADRSGEPRAQSQNHL
jgi:hypothetical protein